MSETNNYMKRHTLMLRWTLALVVLMMIGLGVAGFFWVYPFKVIEFDKLPLDVDKSSPIRPGDYVPVHWKFQKFVDTPAHVLVTLINGRQVMLDDVWSGRGRGRYDYIGGATRLPDDLKPGKWRLKYTFYYELNPIRQVSFQIETEVFEVLPKPIPIRPKQKLTTAPCFPDVKPLDEGKKKGLIPNVVEFFFGPTKPSDEPKRSVAPQLQDLDKDRLMQGH